MSKTGSKPEAGRDGKRAASPKSMSRADRAALTSKVLAAREPGKKGRPTLFSDEMATRIIEHIAGGGNLAEFCRNHDDAPDPRTVYGWLSGRVSFFHAFARAKQIRALSRADEMEAIAQKAERGELDFRIARVLLEHLRWLAAKENPALYGDKVTTELSGPGGGPIEVQPMSDFEWNRRLTAALEKGMASGAIRPLFAIGGTIRDDTVADDVP